MRKDKKSEIIASVISLIMLILLVFLTNSKNDENSSYKSFFNRLVLPFEKINFRIKNKNLDNEKYAGKSVDDLIKEKEKLEEENSDLKAEMEAKNILIEENKKLNELLNLKNKYIEFDTIPAKIKYRSTNNFSDYVIIDVGKKDGIERNMIIVSEKGLYGRVDEVFEESSKVQSITDPTSMISVTVGRNEDPVILQGTVKKGRELVLTLIPENYKINKGQLVYTSGKGGVFPEGIYIGTVKSVKDGEDISNKKVFVDISKDYDEVDTLLVIKKKF